jgi:rifampicin phosphotransferase
MIAVPAVAPELARTGGKGTALARLGVAGERVPPFEVIPAETLADHLAAAGLDTAVDAELRGLDERFAGAGADVPRPELRSEITRAATSLQAMVDSLALDAALGVALSGMVERIGGERFAVRSSAIGEDGDRFSFAGQYDSLLGVRPDQLAAAVRACWRSAFSAHVLAYRLRAGSVTDAAGLAVIVQQMVPGDISGVLFTLDPVSGAPDRMRISACRGLGAALVAGAAAADEYLVGRAGALLEVRPLAAGRPLLDGAALQSLAAAGRRIERLQGGPCDIEWTISAGELWILQARPVTTHGLATAASQEYDTASAHHRIIWDNSNIQESYCGVTTPLTFSFARDAYAGVYEQTMRVLGIPERTIAAHRPLLRTLLGVLHGRVYYNLNAWYRGLLLLPAFRRNKEDMERMMGVEEPVDFVIDEDTRFSERLRRLPRLARTHVMLLAAFVRIDRDATRFLHRFDATLRGIDRATIPHRQMGELMAAVDTLRTQGLEQWTTPIINDFHVMMTVGRLRRLVTRATGNGTEPERVLQTLLGGADVAASAGPVLLMLRLAALARQDAHVLAALRDHEGAVALARAGEANAEFGRLLGELLDCYGDRCMGELKLESRSLRDDAPFLVRMLRNYLAGSAPDPAQLAADARAARERAEHAVERTLGPVARIRFRRALTAARRGIRRREELRLARTRLFGAHRDVYRAIGARLHETQRIDRPDDVFHLTVDEIRSWWEGTAVSVELAPIARARRAEFASYADRAAPNRFSTDGAPYDSLPTVDPSAAAAAASVADARVLHGLGCSAGIVEGIVRVVRSPADDLTIDGHILVAPRTDPGWSPLFPAARAIIVERGSLLSHSAVLARELGLPAVVGIPGVVELLRDGERVRVDGSAGTIERLGS